MYRGATDSNLLRNEDAALRQVTDVEDERTTDVVPFAWKDGYRDKEQLAYIFEEVSTPLG
ncbi:hypothetical protein HanXRQr2_Chr17g0821351 [Helianthus annuus]|uniref:Uncharacterized protein n=1 Tax=Helianthus annuus TaxID=4232 RepID=A0A9K3GV69_HELAN|nr:hypothetical protein HanXRQr2_Chr17g0821351 [Helianthus annuus]